MKMATFGSVDLVFLFYIWHIRHSLRLRDCAGQSGIALALAFVACGGLDSHGGALHMWRGGPAPRRHPPVAVARRCLRLLYIGVFAASEGMGAACRSSSQVADHGSRGVAGLQGIMILISAQVLFNSFVYLMGGGHGGPLHTGL